MVKTVLGRLLPDFEVEEVTTPDALSRTLRRGETDLVITETDLPGTVPLQVLHTVRLEGPRIHAILFTRAARESVVMEAVKAGFDDYVLKASGCEGRLESALRSTLQRMEDDVRQHRPYPRPDVKLG
jgi:DNA-binding NarL/FixJ family response regulator